MSDVSAYSILPAGSPDATSLVDLTIYDLDATAIYAQCLANAQAAFPDWTPVAGNTEVVILQACALAAAELGYAINRLPLAVLQALAILFNVQQNLGVAPSTIVNVTFSDTTGHLLPAGTTLSYQPYGDPPIYFTTDYDLNVPAGSNSGSVTVTGTTATSSANGVAAGTVLTVIDATVPIASVVTLQVITGGVDPETTQAWLTRAAGVLQSTTNTVAIPTQFQQAAIDTIGVWRAAVLDNFEPSYYSQWGASTGASALGYITVAVYNQGQVPCTTAVKQQLQTQLANNCVAGLAVNVIDANVTVVNASVTAVAQSGWLTTDVTNSIIYNITNGDGTYPGLTTDQWPWGRHVRILDLYHLASEAAGVDYVSAISLSSPTAGASVVGGASVGSPITLQNPVNLLPTSPDYRSFEDGSADWGASVGFGLFWPYNQSGYQTPATVSNSTSWAAVGTHSEEISYSASYGASTNPSLWISPASINIPTLAAQPYTISAVVNFGNAGSVLNMNYANQLLWLVGDTAGNTYQAQVSASINSNGIATFLGTFTTTANPGNINSMTLFLMAGYGSTPGWVNGPIYIDNLGLWQGIPITADELGPVTGFPYNESPVIVASFVAGDLLLGGITPLGLATLGTLHVDVAPSTGAQS